MASRDTLERIEAIGRDTLAELPEPFAKGARDLVLRVVPQASQDQLAQLGLRHPLDLTGLYEGIPMTEKSVFDQPMGPDTVWLFAEAILDGLSERPGETLETLVRHVTVHEVAHHFGWSDDDIAQVDRWWE